MSNNRCFYPVTDPQGFCIIININQYSVFSDRMNGLDKERHGSQRDVERVKRLFEKLHFIVEVREYLSAEEIDNFLSEVKRSPELAKHGSFVCFLMAHGYKGSDAFPCNISDLTAKFQSNVCSCLTGKPKLFFVQAYRGSHANLKEWPTTAIDLEPVAPELGLAGFYPVEGDFLVSYTTTEGQVSHRDKERDSFFVQTLCDCIEKHYEKEHLEDIMKLVNRHMINNPHQEGKQIFRRVFSTEAKLAYKVSFDPSRAEQC